MLSRHTIRTSRAATRAFAVSRATEDKVGFIGLGNMGGPMAKNLVKGGHDVFVFDVNQAAVDGVVGVGANAAPAPADIAAECDTVITMLPSNPHVKQVYLGDKGIVEAARANALFIDCSTIDPTVTREVEKHVTARGCRMVDAPVSGGVGGAEAGTLTFMVGGAVSDFEASKTFLNHMGKNLFHCGDIGTGEVAKLCNNLILAISMAGVSEAMNLGVNLGANPKALADIINVSSGRCWSSDTNNPCPGVMEGVPSSRGYTGGFGAKLMRKDVGLALDAGKETSSPLPMGNAAFGLLETLIANNLGDRDFSVIYAFLRGGLDNAQPPAKDGK